MTHWRNFQGQVEMTLAPRVFLLGPNASGKSNVLDALRFLRDTADQGLQAAISSRGGMGAIRSFHARRPPGFNLAITVGNKNRPAQWRYSLQVRNHPQKHVPEVVAEIVTDGSGAPVLRRPTEEDQTDPHRLRQTHLEQVVANQGFRPLTEFLTSIRYLHIVPQLMRDLERSTGRRNDPFGADFLEAIATTPQRTRDARLRKISRLPFPSCRISPWSRMRGGTGTCRFALPTGARIQPSRMNGPSPTERCDSLACSGPWLRREDPCCWRSPSWACTRPWSADCPVSWCACIAVHRGSC